MESHRVGMAMAAKVTNRSFWTYVLVGEGCLNEGQSGNYHECGQVKPKNFVLMVDYNKVQLDGTEEEIMTLGSLSDKLKSFGWNVCPHAYDGNNTEDVLSSYDWMDQDDVWPKAVIYDTIKGKGISFTEGKSSWHGAVIDDDSYAKGIVELKKDLQNKEAVL